MSEHFAESTPGDDEPTVESEQYSLSIGDDLLAEALAAVEKRESEAKKREIGVDGPIDLDELAAMESELAIEVEDEADDIISAFTSGTQDPTVRLRAMEAEAERDALQSRLQGLDENRVELAAKLKQLSNRAAQANASTHNAKEAQRAAESHVATLKSALDQQQKDIDRLLDRRKQEKTEDYTKGKTEALLALAEGIDNLALALEHADTNPEAVIEGVRMTLVQFEGNLSKMGVTSIEPQAGETFDPGMHEAISEEPSDTLKPGQIVDMITRGYRTENQLLRAARVRVASRKSPTKSGKK